MLRAAILDKGISLESVDDLGGALGTSSREGIRLLSGVSPAYAVQRDYVFEPKIFAELRNAQAVVLAYDGLNPHPPTCCYLKPYYLNPNVTYFEQLSRGAL